MKKILALPFIGCILLAPIMTGAQTQPLLLKNVILIDGTGKPPRPNTDVLIQGDTIARTGSGLSVKGATIINLQGKTIMPSLISAHTHIGTLKGKTVDAKNYTRENILRQLKQYEEYGVTAILSMGTDRPLIFNGFRDSSIAGLLPGARLYSATYGFGAPNGGPPAGSAMDNIFRPATSEEARKDIDEIHLLNPTVVKIWVDDFNGRYVKMQPEVYKEIIERSHKYNLRVAAHLYYLEDAKKLVASGVDIIAHSIRDKDIDEELLNEMKEKGIVYIPTLSRDEFAFIYAQNPEWINNNFFKASLEPGVYEMITGKDYQDKLKASPDYEENIAAVETAMRNLKKIFDAGILIAMGTDSGATPLRPIGFAEHLELELMVDAGLTPLQAIGAATGGTATALKINDKYGVLEKGKMADFIILSDDPTIDIKNTRKIEAVYKAGKQVSKGPARE